MTTSRMPSMPSIRSAALAAATVLALVGPALASDRGPTCEPAGDVLCLVGGRFQVEVDWDDPGGASGRGQAGDYVEETGYFTFEDARYLEMLVSVEDRCDPVDVYWVLATGFVDRAITLTITDHLAGTIKVYSSPAGTFMNLLDTAAFPCMPASAPPEGLGGSIRLPSRGPSTLPLAGGRLLAEVAWETGGGAMGSGIPVPLTSHGGAFGFFDAERLDLGVKAFDDRDTSGFFQLTFGGTTTVGFTLTVTDVCSATVRSYDHPFGPQADPVVDATAFAALPDCLAIFSDGFETGDTSLWSATVP